MTATTTAAAPDPTTATVAPTTAVSHSWPIFEEITFILGFHDNDKVIVSGSI